MWKRWWKSKIKWAGRVFAWHLFCLYTYTYPPRVYSRPKSTSGCCIKLRSAYHTSETGVAANGTPPSLPVDIVMTVSSLLTLRSPCLWVPSYYRRAFFPHNFQSLEIIGDVCIDIRRRSVTIFVKFSRRTKNIKFANIPIFGNKKKRRENK